MKYVVAAVLALAVYIALGATIAAVAAPAIKVHLLGEYGTFTYKGLLALAVFGLMVSGKK